MREHLTRAARSGRWQLRNARIPRCFLQDSSSLPSAGDGLVTADVVISERRIESISPPGAIAVETTCDLARSMLWPGLVDCHTHLDKAHIWPRAANPDGTFAGAISATEADQGRHWTATDLRRRMDFALRSAYAHGTVAIRTHLDMSRERLSAVWGVLRELQADWCGKITLQGVAFLSLTDVADDDFISRVVEEMHATPGAILGAFVEAFPEHQSTLPGDLSRLFGLAGRHGFAIDLHVDETIDTSSNGLEATADAVLATRHDGSVLCGHCCALSVHDDDRRLRTIEKIARTSLSIVTLPLCNAYLQDRNAGRTPRLRGTAPVHELAAAGIPVAIASDNIRDPFYAYGDLDLVEVFRTALRLQHLDHPVGTWPSAIANTAARVMGMADVGLIAPGGIADLIVFNARGWSELVARPQVDRVVIRYGTPITDGPPDYRELDDLEGFENATHF